MSNEPGALKYIYWLGDAELTKLKKQMAALDKEMNVAAKCPCEAIKGEIGYANPQTWSVICQHDAAIWYGQSKHEGKYVVGSSFALDESFEPFLETTLREVSFSPPPFPTSEEKRELAQDPVFLSGKPDRWDDFPMAMREPTIKGLGTLPGKPVGTWDELFLNWTAVHANFVSPKYRADNNFANVPYSIADSKNINSCCVELFNLLDSKEEGLLVRPCVGAMIMEAAKQDQYYLVNMVKNKK
jgi:hypothetical protein